MEAVQLQRNIFKISLQNLILVQNLTKLTYNEFKIFVKNKILSSFFLLSSLKKDQNFNKLEISIF